MGLVPLGSADEILHIQYSIHCQCSFYIMYEWNNTPSAYPPVHAGSSRQLNMVSHRESPERKNCMG
jgi:hypothetical protein